jgi:hypothetical protein
VISDPSSDNSRVSLSEYQTPDEILFYLILQNCSALYEKDPPPLASFLVLISILKGILK